MTVATEPIAATLMLSGKNPREGTMGQVVKGMVHLEGTTYRIVRIKRGHYSVVRVLDDIAVGTFTSGAAIEISPQGIDPTVLRDVVRLAIQGAKTSWVGRVALPATPDAKETT
jgi:hypothetical protein